MFVSQGRHAPPVAPTKRVLTAVVLLVSALAGCGSGSTEAQPTDLDGFSMRVVATGLDGPWEIAWGPDGFLWVTEKVAGRVVRISPGDGSRTTALTVPDLLATRGAQDGLLGMALHPGLLGPGADQYVYLAYTYDASDGGQLDRRAKIVRYEYDDAAQQLTGATDLITGLPASVDHDSGRLVFGPDQTLYYTIGDQGHNQFDLFCLPIEAQRLPTAPEVQAEDWSAYEGKVLRLNLDGSIPADNPVLDGVRSHVYSYGHRNAQGLVFGSTERLYASEHGPKADDEVNLIVAGGNYGWPRVSGHKDDQSYVYANWSASQATPCTALSYSDYELPGSVPQQLESTFDDPSFVPPLRTFSTVEQGYNFRDPRCQRSYFICWPTVAPSSLDYYPADGAVPGWGESLLMPSLKDGTVYRIPLSAEGTVAGEAEALWRTVNRYRDLAIAPDTQTFYVATDAAGLARDLDGLPTGELANPAAIVEFRLLDAQP